MKVKIVDKNTVELYKKGFIVLDNKIYTNPTDETLFKAGYKELKIEDQPEYNMETQYVEPVYSDGGNVITQSWEVKDIP